MNIEEAIEHANNLFKEGMYYESMLEYTELHVIGQPINLDIFNKISSQEVDSVREKAMSDYQRAKRILSIGNQWNEDELLLVMLLRINLELVTVVFTIMGIKLDMKLGLLDADLERISNTKNNSSNYNKAKKVLFKNSKLPKEFLLTFIR